jgi:hypothetical protein
MSQVADDASLLRYFGLLEAHNPNLLDLLGADSEATFIQATENAIERAIRTIESGAKHYSRLDERGLSLLLADFLNMSGYQATAERFVNGHVDVVVEHAFGGRWKYLGECRIYDGFKYHVAGCEQLLGYCTGRERRAFCMDFFRVVGMFDKLRAVREQMDQERPLAQSAESADHGIRGAFVTPHRHTSGAAVEILHLGCNIEDR